MPADGRAATAGRPWRIVLVALVVLGAVLRIIGARGELCLDEVWTLGQLSLVTAPLQILVDLANDNNHILTSLWLYAAGGAQASPLWLRTLAIAFGAASVVAAGAAMHGRGRASVIVAMALAAVAYPLVHYGSEARGYAGFVLFVLVSIACLARELETPDGRSRAILGAAIGLGLLSHLAMAPAATVLALWTAWVIFRRTGRLVATLVRTLAIFAPALMWTLAVATFYAIAWLRHGFEYGNFPFGAIKFIDAYGTLLALMIGIPPQVPPAIVCAAALALVAAAAWRWRGDGDIMNGLYVGAIIVLPAAMLVARLPNTEFARHFLFSAIVFLLFIAELFGRLWEQKGLRRAVALALLIACLAGNAASLARFYASGRGHYVDAISAMAAEGTFTFASNHDFRNRMMTEFYGKKLGVAATLIRAGHECDQPPAWWLSDSSQELPDRMVLGGARCTLTFERRRVYPLWGLSGVRLTLYRRADGEIAPSRQR